MSIKISSYFCGNRWQDTKGEFATIADKLIRLTAKITDNYASDIFYELRTYYDWLQSKRRNGATEDFHTIFFFRENGVSSYDVTGTLPVPYNAQFEAIQTWELYHSKDEDNDDDYGILRRVNFKSMED